MGDFHSTVTQKIGKEKEHQRRWIRSESVKELVCGFVDELLLLFTFSPTAESPDTILVSRVPSTESDT